MNYIEASTAKHFEDAKSIFKEYQKFIGIDLYFQDFQSELKEIPGKYSAPRGAIILAYNKQTCAGCVALRPVSESVCEIKRLFVKPEFQGKSIGRELASRIIMKAIAIGYLKMRLDTLDTMEPAMHLYRQLGFKEIAPYYHNPIKNARYFEYELQAGIPHSG
jgi:putative acetyltransferase